MVKIAFITNSWKRERVSLVLSCIITGGFNGSSLPWHKEHSCESSLASNQIKGVDFIAINFGDGNV